MIVRCAKDNPVEKINLQPLAASNPNPIDGATNQTTSLILSWASSDPENDPLTYDIYFGEMNPPASLITGNTNTAFDPGTLKNNTRYYWKIISKDNQNNFTEGSIWSFTTGQPVITIPVLSTLTVSNITTVTAVSGGNITNDGGGTITLRGVCWSTGITPTINDTKTADGTGSGIFTSSITGLAPNTSYFVRAYATNSAGTGYGNIVNFSTITNNTLEYLGQTPPGRDLKPFAPNIIGNWNHAEVTVSANGQEIYWTNRTSIYYTKLQNNSWTAPQIVTFSGKGTSNYYDDVPIVSPDNKKLFFLSQRAISYSSSNKENIWYVNRTSNGWSEPIPLPLIVNSTPGIHWQVSIANNGNLYFGAITDSMRIFVSPFIDGEYTKPEPLNSINKFGNVTCPFISPDESYMIFTKVIDGYPSSYIIFKGKDGKWLTPNTLSVIRTTSFVSRDGKYLFSFFNWISAEILEDYRPNN